MSDFILNIDSNSDQIPAFRETIKSKGNWKQRRKVEKDLKRKHKKIYQAKVQASTNLEVQDIHNDEIDSEGEYKELPQNPKKRALTRQEKVDSDDEIAPSKEPQKQEVINYKTKSTSLFTSIVPATQTQTLETDSIETRGDNFLKVSSNNVINSESGFVELGLLPFFSSHLQEKLSIEKPTEIQRLVLSNSLSPNTISSKSSTYSNRDCFIRAETGSGKTLSYLLPIINRLLLATQDCSRVSSQSNTTPKTSDFPTRKLGTMAIILTPTRELAKQVYETASKLVNISRSSYSQEKDKDTDVSNPSSADSIRSHWIVTGVAIGGDKKQSEKARLRKGVTILACTPGRLLDHLKTTSSFNTFNLKWLVLDEADQLLELGFQDTLNEIIQLLSEKSPFNGELSVKNSFLSSPHIPKSRINILCSATLKGDVKKLAQVSLNNPIFFNSHKLQPDTILDSSGNKVVVFSDDSKNESTSQKSMDVDFDIPDQLEQDFLVVPPKLKLVALASLLNLITNQSKNSKIIVFLSCRDSVNFYYDLFSNAWLHGEQTNTSQNITTPPSASDSENSDNEDDVESEEPNDTKTLPETDQKTEDSTKKSLKIEVSKISKFLANTSVYRLHGSLSQPIRSATISNFTSSPKPGDPTNAKILFCTDVASRGLDLPLVSHIVQYDAPTDISGYVHRIGRTARLGQLGKAVLFLMPSEIDYLKLLTEKNISIKRINFKNYINPESPDSKFLSSVARSSKVTNSVTGSNELEILLKVYSVVQGGKASKWMDSATELQLAFEKFVLSSNEATQLSKSAFTSSVRAYATHSPSQKRIFHIKNLHLGHYAKSFGLREAPKTISVGNKVHSTSNKKQQNENKNSNDGNYTRPTKPKISQISEFSVGTIESMMGPRTKKHK
ncbi:ATP-dependent RNA helicase DBP7 [Smittium mucronatum]|uniref:ATP-dependent RNA helicase n=1 Tax=Smittium mucronatum TaxID=133383 RepID=A0A1R0H9I8_9FUNG|nr:ATP-dependent RNA helicase DBP7 [Smittium mucronatum]